MFVDVGPTRSELEKRREARASPFRRLRRRALDRPRGRPTCYPHAPRPRTRDRPLCEAGKARAPDPRFPGATPTPAAAAETRCRRRPDSERRRGSAEGRPSARHGPPGPRDPSATTDEPERSGRRALGLGSSRSRRPATRPLLAPSNLSGD